MTEGYTSHIERNVSLLQLNIYICTTDALHAFPSRTVGNVV